MKTEKKICAWCYYARMRKDICGIYCTGGFENKDGTCERFRDSKKGKKTVPKLNQPAPEEGEQNVRKTD